MVLCYRSGTWDLRYICGRFNAWPGHRCMVLGQLSCLPSEVVTTKFSISPLTYLRKISLRTTANISATENQRVSVERLLRYGDLTIFKMAPIRHLGFSKLKFLKVRAVTRPILHCRTNFVKIRQTVAEISWFLWFQDSGRRHLGFKISKF